MGIRSEFRSNPIARSMREFIGGLGSRADSPFISIVKNLEESKISNVMDIGANVGQFGLDIRRHGFQGQIFSYEPVHKAFMSLTQTTEKFQPWKPFKLGLGSAESELEINVSGNSGLSSSILEMRSLHLENFPNSATVAKQKISISTVDKQLTVLGIQPDELMMKIDVQGFEAEVLKGASRSLSSIPLCYLEVSIAQLYEGELTFLQMLNELSKYGHEVIDVFRGTKAKNGQLLQLDILTKLSKK